MCGPANQMRIEPKRIKSISKMKEFCRECPMYPVILEKEDNEHFKTSN
jgi:hypothetical protein